MNRLWKKYGCTKCDNYQVLVLTVNFAEDKSVFKSGFVDKHKVENICVSAENGGKLFNTALKNQSAGGPTYLIKPDKSIVGDMNTMKMASEKDITAAGIVPHVCSTPNLSAIPHTKHSHDFKAYLNGSSLHIVVPSEDRYDITLYTLNGQQMYHMPVNVLMKGSHTFDLSHICLTSQTYLVVIHSKNVTIRQKIQHF